LHLSHSLLCISIEGSLFLKSKDLSALIQHSLIYYSIFYHDITYAPFVLMINNLMLTKALLGADERVINKINCYLLNLIAKCLRSHLCLFINILSLMYQYELIQFDKMWAKFQYDYFLMTFFSVENRFSFLVTFVIRTICYNLARGLHLY
jgi:hypothetical protein